MRDGQEFERIPIDSLKNPEELTYLPAERQFAVSVRQSGKIRLLSRSGRPQAEIDLEPLGFGTEFRLD